MLKLPDGFEWVSTKGCRAAVRSEFKTSLQEQDALTLATFERLRTAGKPAGHGRAAAGLAELSGVGHVVLRRGRRGGLLGGLLGNRYLAGQRPVEELVVAEAARDAGVPVPEYIAALIWPSGPCYSAGLIVREVPNAMTLETWLRERKDEDIAVIVKPLADALGRLFAAGIYHADLHAGNMLVSQGPDRPSLHLIDFDKAVRYDRLPERLRALMLFRFNRGLVKRGLSPHPVEPALRLRLCKELGLAGEEIKRFVAACEAHLKRHRGHYRTK
jgi:hypothetical protein